ncbi:MAG: hypothetical protein ACTSR3_18255 [Candidatus Helarchaeota archaeon]
MEKWIITSAISTAVIAVFTVCNFFFNRAILKKDEEFKQQVKDLYQAIVIATILSGPTSHGEFDKAKNEFKKVYKGKTCIF